MNRDKKWIFLQTMLSIGAALIVFYFIGCSFPNKTNDVNAARSAPMAPKTVYSGAIVTVQAPIRSNVSMITRVENSNPSNSRPLELFSKGLLVRVPVSDNYSEFWITIIGDPSDLVELEFKYEKSVVGEEKETEVQTSSVKLDQEGRGQTSVRIYNLKGAHLVITP